MSGTLEPREKGGPIQKFWEDNSTTSQLGKYSLTIMLSFNHVIHSFFHVIYSTALLFFCICLETIKTWLMKNAKKHVTADPPTAKSLSQLIQQFIQMQASLYNFRFFKSFPSKAKINFTYILLKNFEL